MILDPQLALVHPSKQDRAEMDVPEPIADLAQSNVLAGERVGDAHPSAFPADPAVSADVANLVVSGVLELR